MRRRVPLLVEVVAPLLLLLLLLASSPAACRRQVPLDYVDEEPTGDVGFEFESHFLLMPEVNLPEDFLMKGTRLFRSTFHHQALAHPMVTGEIDGGKGGFDIEMVTWPVKYTLAGLAALRLQTAVLQIASRGLGHMAHKQCSSWEGYSFPPTLRDWGKDIFSRKFSGLRRLRSALKVLPAALGQYKVSDVFLFDAPAVTPGTGNRVFITTPPKTGLHGDLSCDQLLAGYSYHSAETAVYYLPQVSASVPLARMLQLLTHMPKNLVGLESHVWRTAGTWAQAGTAGKPDRLSTLNLSVEQRGFIAYFIGVVNSIIKLKEGKVEYNKVLFPIMPRTSMAQYFRHLFRKDTAIAAFNEALKLAAEDDVLDPSWDQPAANAAPLPQFKHYISSKLKLANGDYQMAHLSLPGMVSNWQLPHALGRTHRGSKHDPLAAFDVSRSLCALDLLPTPPPPSVASAPPISPPYIGVVLEFRQIRKLVFGNHVAGFMQESFEFFQTLAQTGEVNQELFSSSYGVQEHSA
eukprot:gnl/Hemi2/16597_TR5560_c0_g1_i1.p1 gnl/Hemi2/16597_TR5560_c0_g1~~gnl/Hemi2/16597_TR5560_c0_g1_i1.p1  ORF type:complete len:518 (-),score=139.73 gnl/Hemi2/16597_TR5560_c0_g1_i1:160-1713(-)